MSLVTRVRPDQLVDRIVATYYRREYVDNEARLLRSPVRKLPLSELVTAGRRAVYFGTSTLESEEAPADWVPFLTSDDIDDSGCTINLDARRRVSPEFADRYPNGVLRENELLVKVKGPNQTTAYQETCPTRRIQVSGTIWGSLVRKDRVDPYYLVAVLSSPYAALARTRLRTNLNVEFLSPDDLLTVVLPVPMEFSVQQYIGGKVRQAERLRERARALECEIQQLSTTEEIEAALRLPESLTNRLNASDLGHRLDSKHYGLRATAVFKACGKNCVTIQEFGPDVSNGFEYREFCDSGIPYVTVGDVSTGRLNLESAPRIPSSVDIPEKARLDVMCILVVRSGSIGAAAKVVAEDTDACISSHLIRLRFKDEESAAVVACFLNSPAGRAIQQKIVYGGVQPQISQHELLEIPIPRDVAQRGTQLLNLLNRREQAIRMAQRLTTAAKVLVEALIEGKVTEADLKDANGNRDADRANLPRLTRKGIDMPNESPLFPNLNDLYAALDESADAAVTVEAHG